MNLLDITKKSRELGIIQKEEELIAFAGFVTGIRPKNVLEIGSWKGGLFYIMSQILPHEGVKMSVDLDGYNNFDMKARNERMITWADNVKILNANSHDQSTYDWVKNNLGNEKLDFLMIDGDHSYEGSKMDYEMYKGFVREGGWIGFHDILATNFHIRMGCEVYKTWQSISGEKYEFIIDGEWGGIGVIRV